MITSRKIISLWKWAILSIIIIFILFFVTAPLSGQKLEFIHLIVSFSLLVNAVLVVIIPLVASFIMKKSFFMAFIVIVTFNVIGSVILFFIYRRSVGY